MNQHVTLLRVPENMSAREIGVYIAHLRDQFHLSQQEVSERLHIRTRYVSAIEEGRFDLMPGKVYARGYLHKYAEFLGLDADQIVGQCLPTDSDATPRLAPIRVATAPRPSTVVPRRGYGMWVVLALVAAFAAQQLWGGGDATDTEAVAVAPVPEAMLHSVRNMVMPTPNNAQCLTTDTLLGCFYSDNITRALTRLHANNALPFGQDVDLSLMTQVETPAAQATAEDAEKTPTPADVKEITETADE